MISLRNALLTMLVTVFPFSAGLSQEADNLEQVAEWLNQGVSSALFTREQANIMLEALQGNSEATEAYIQTQVSAGMNLSAAAKAAIAEHVLTQRTVPADRLAAGMTADAANTSGKFVASIDIVQGEIFITYGNESHSSITGKVLVLTPFISEDRSVVWRCGYSEIPETVRLFVLGADTGTSATNIDARYLPRACRAQS